MSSSGLRTIDLMHLGHPRGIGAHLIDEVIVDPGCEKTVGRVVETLDGETPRAVLLTHIHFDHAGGTGRLVELYPDLEVRVHEEGARHLVDPERLVASARKVFGEHFDDLWGEVVPIPERNLRVLSGGESEGAWEVAHTPGHARHHVCYFHRPTRTAFTGDVTGIRIDDGPAFPPTPPPDFDPDLWHRSLDTLAEWEPDRLAYMHFGQTTSNIPGQIAMMHEALDQFSGFARANDARTMTGWIREWIIDRGGEGSIDDYWRAGPFEGMWSGIDHYWQRQAAPAPD